MSLESHNILSSMPFLESVIFTSGMICNSSVVQCNFYFRKISIGSLGQRNFGTRFEKIIFFNI
jgi:hypothetical protein